MTQAQTTPKTRRARRKITHTINEWSWNHDNLKSKIKQGATPNACCDWTGSTGPETHLFGGFKNKVAQMNQARRLYWMGEHNQDIADYRITMTCHNTHCMNILHMKLAPNLKLYKGDGITPAEPQDSISLRFKTEHKPKVVKQPKVVKEPKAKGRPRKARVIAEVKQIDLTAKEEQW
jgi:hypothetical protein